LDTQQKGYLTDARAGKGVVPFSLLRHHVNNSKHPEIEVIRSGAPPYFHESPPKYADGRRCDVWYDAYTLAWYQRWQQWKKDLKDFGHIKFFEQNFNDFPVNDCGYAGGRGDVFYLLSMVV
jgi:hypothetical protein